MTAHVIVLGNEKGGSGKSTTSVHLAVALAHAGHRVGALDLDHRQRTTARYIENRREYAAKHALTLAMPEVVVITDDDGVRLGETLSDWSASKDAIIIDTPGRDSALTRACLAYADTLVTPINDSFVDFDLLGQVDPDTFKVRRPSFYAELVWDARKQRAQLDGGSVDWVVLRNRVASLEARNMKRVAQALGELSRRIGFRVVPGLAERVIYRELFPRGLTLLDTHLFAEVSLAHVTAKNELRAMMTALALPPPLGDAAPRAQAAA